MIDTMPMGSGVKTRVKLTSVRWKFTPITAGVMLEIAKPIMDAVKARILSGTNVHGNTALPLSMKYRATYKDGRLIRMGADRGYRSWKGKRFPPAIRNWKLTGFTMNQMGVLAAEPGRAVIGFKEAVRPAMTVTGKTGNVFYMSRPISVNKLVGINQATEKMFGLSVPEHADFLRRVKLNPAVSMTVGRPDYQFTDPAGRVWTGYTKR
jgi:hypothetical protein